MCGVTFCLLTAASTGNRAPMYINMDAARAFVA